MVVHLLVLSSLLLSFGRLSDLRRHKGLYVWGFVVFVAASAMCGLAPTVGVLVTARGVQAIGTAILYSNTPAILTMLSMACATSAEPADISPVKAVFSSTTALTTSRLDTI